MTWTISPAVRDTVPLLFGIAGATSSGKTYSALRVGTGMQQITGGDIGVLDTEAKRALHYADEFKFMHVPFVSPFNGARYLEAIRFMVGNGVKTIIVDSMSHEHEGEGGHLSMHEGELDRMAGRDYAKRERVKFAAWIKPAAERRAFLNGLQQISANFIFCFRAKEKIALVKNNGKIEPLEMGWQPIAGAEIAFEMTAMVVLPPKSLGVPDYAALADKVPGWSKPIFADGKPLDETVGAQLAAWARGDNSGSVGPSGKSKAEQAVDALILEIEKATTSSEIAEVLIEDKSAKQIAWLKEKRPEEYARLDRHISAHRTKVDGDMPGETVLR